MDILNKIGFEEKEKAIYLTLLKLGRSTASEISETSKIERTLCYSILQKLIDKAIVSYIIKNNVKSFSAINPRSLLESLKEKEKELRESLPKLEELMNSNNENTRAEVYSGKEGIKFILRDIIKQKSDYMVLGEEGRFQEILPIESEQFMRKIEHAKIKERVLVKNGGEIVKSKNSKFKFLPKNYLSPASTVIYGGKVAILIWSEPLTMILIDNVDVAKSYKNYFNLLWNQKF